MTVTTFTCEGLTGRVRARRGFRGKLVLQVEERGTTEQNIAGHIDTWHTTRWRDATWEDMNLIKLKAERT